MDAAEGMTTEDDARDTNLFIAKEAAKDSQALSSTDTSVKTLDTIRFITETLIRISAGLTNSAEIIQ